jgi:hypothetical protein
MFVILQIENSGPMPMPLDFDSPLTFLSPFLILPFPSFVWRTGDGYVPAVLPAFFAAALEWLAGPPFGARSLKRPLEHGTSGGL